MRQRLLRRLIKRTDTGMAWCLLLGSKDPQPGKSPVKIEGEIQGISRVKVDHAIASQKGRETVYCILWGLLPRAINN